MRNNVLHGNTRTTLEYALQCDMYYPRHISVIRSITPALYRCKACVIRGGGEFTIAHLLMVKTPAPELFLRRGVFDLSSKWRGPPLHRVAEGAWRPLCTPRPPSRTDKQLLSQAGSGRCDPRMSSMVVRIWSVVSPTNSAKSSVHITRRRWLIFWAPRQ